MDRAPCVVISPQGETYAPVRATSGEQVTDGGPVAVIELRDKAGVLLVTLPSDRVAEGRKHATVYTPDGAWTVRDLCGCNSQYKAWKREWEQG